MDFWPNDPESRWRYTVAFLYRALVLFRMDNPGEALSNYNEFAAGMAVDGLPLLDYQSTFGQILRDREKTSPIRMRPEGSGSASKADVGLRPVAGTDATSGETDIRREIDAIARSGQYSPLPEAQLGLSVVVSIH